MKEYTHNYIITREGEVINKRTKKVLKPYESKNGYLQIMLYDFRGAHKKFLIHRLVAQTYLPNPHNYPQVNHKNMDKKDNRVENLEWCTATENLRHARKYGRNIYTAERNAKISKARRGIKRSPETVKKLSKYMKNLCQSMTPEEKAVFTHRLHSFRPSPTCPLCLANNQHLTRIYK